MSAQKSPKSDDEVRSERRAIEDHLELIAIIDRKVRVPMRDGTPIATDIYRPKDTSKKYPIIFVRTPYNFNYWDVQLGAPRDMSEEVRAVEHGYAYVEMNERGKLFSGGNWDVLGLPLTDSDDELDWMSAQPWSSGKVGLVGCSSTAEWQPNVASRGNKALATFIPEGYGAGIGRMGPYFEQGNFYRGGAVQMLFIPWLAGEQNELRPQFPRDMSQQELIEASKFFDLVPKLPSIDWMKALEHLPEQDIVKAAGGPHGVFADSMSVPTGGKWIQRTPQDPAWYGGGLFNDNMNVKVPGLWLISWYDISTGPNLAAYNYVRRTAAQDIADKQYAIIAPTMHCGYKAATEHTVVGTRDLGDARLDYDALTYGWFDHFLKGEDNGILERMPRVRYFTIGLNRWQASDTWPPSNAKPVTFYLSSNGNAETLHGDGVLQSFAPHDDFPDGFTYDPGNPVPGSLWPDGSNDQRSKEERKDVLVYSSEILKEGVEVSGPMEATIYLSSDVKDTDLTVKVLDVYPDGNAYNIDETIQRVRWRDGFDQPPVFLEAGKVYKVTFTPMQTSSYFAAGHRIRIEVSSSDFPRFDRNLNTGGNNYDETEWIVAHTQIHHSVRYPSQIILSIVESN
jgi:putative CocE/NonD family hydrolase